MVFLGGKYGLYEMCWWLLGWFLFEILSLLAPTSLHPPSPAKGHRAGPFKQPWLSFCLSVSPLSNTLCRDLYYRMAKMEMILSTFTLLSLHLTGLLRIPIKTFFHMIKWWKRGAVVEWLEQLGYGAESRRIAWVRGSAAPCGDWKTLSVNPAENGYLFRIREE